MSQTKSLTQRTIYRQGPENKKLTDSVRHSNHRQTKILCNQTTNRQKNSTTQRKAKLP